MLIILRSLVILLGLSVVAHAAAKPGPSVLFDAKTGEVIAQDRAGEPWYPASLTKLMTAYVIFKKLRAGKIKLEDKVIVSAYASSQPASKIGIRAGGTVSIDFALQALLVYSANDMAYVLAEAGAGTVKNFVDEMNGAALQLGLSSTHFVNPNGLFEPRQLTTARDIGVLAAVVLTEYPEHAHYFAQEYVAVGKRKLMNRNSLIRSMPDADGMKTGFVCNSGYNLLASATRNGRKLIAVVMGAPSGQGRANLAQSLLLEGFANAPSETNPRLAQVANLSLGALVPADMTSSVCKNKQAFTLATAEDLGGWGISFGNYDTGVIADMALRGRLIAPAGLDAPGKNGIVRMPDKAGYAAMIWNIDQPTALQICAQYREEQALCEVMPPIIMQQLAATIAKSTPPKAAPIAQGSDAAKKPAAKKKRKKVKIN